MVDSLVDIADAGQQEHWFHHCYFKPADEEPTLNVIPSGESRKGFHCRRCETVIVLRK